MNKSGIDQETVNELALSLKEAMDAGESDSAVKKITDSITDRWVAMGGNPADPALLDFVVCLFKDLGELVGDMTAGSMSPRH